MLFIDFDHRRRAFVDVRFVRIDDRVEGIATRLANVGVAQHQKRVAIHFELQRLRGESLPHSPLFAAKYRRASRINAITPSHSGARHAESVSSVLISQLTTIPLS